MKQFSNGPPTNSLAYGCYQCTHASCPQPAGAGVSWDISLQKLSEGVGLFSHWLF